MSAKKLRHPPPLESERPKEVRTTNGDLFKDDLHPLNKVSKRSEERPRTFKPRLASYLIIGVVFMVVFEIILMLGAGEDYKYFSIYAYDNDLTGKIFEGNTEEVITVGEINITLKNYDKEFDYFLSDVKIEDETYVAEFNNTTGEYKFSGIPCGRYILNVSIQGYQPEHRKVVVVPDYVDPGGDENKEDFHMTKLATGSLQDNIILSGDFKSESLNNYIEITYICFVIIGIFVVFMILGMIHSFRSKKYSIAIAGAIFGILAGLITFFSIGSVISVGALIFIIMSKSEFES